MARMRKKKNLIPRMEKTSVYLIDEPQELKGKWREALALSEDSMLTLELGCGKGSFAVKTARKISETGVSGFFIAMDKVKEALVIGMESAFADDPSGGLPVRFIAGDCAELADLFAPGEINTVCVNFCDPWPNKRHYKRRITWDDFLKCYAVLLGSEGVFRFKTDNEPLYGFTLERLEACGYTLTASSRDLHSTDIPNITTEYEEKFSAMGMPIYYAEAVPPRNTESSVNSSSEA